MWCAHKRTPNRQFPIFSVFQFNRNFYRSLVNFVKRVLQSQLRNKEHVFLKIKKFVVNSVRCYCHIRLCQNAPWVTVKRTVVALKCWINDSSLCIECNLNINGRTNMRERLLMYLTVVKVLLTNSYLPFRSTWDNKHRCHIRERWLICWSEKCALSFKRDDQETKKKKKPSEESMSTLENSVEKSSSCFVSPNSSWENEVKATQWCVQAKQTKYKKLNI